MQVENQKTNRGQNMKQILSFLVALIFFLDYKGSVGIRVKMGHFIKKAYANINFGSSSGSGAASISSIYCPNRLMCSVM